MYTSFRRPNPVFSDAYGVIRDAIVDARRTAGISQRAFAERIGKHASHICMIETGQRRIDTLELFTMAKGLGLEPTEFFREIAARLEASSGTAGTSGESG